MSLAHGILGFLSYGKMSGYDLSKAFGASAQFFWTAQNSQIYLELDKLEKNKLVKHKLVVQSDKPNKKLYSITDAGREEFLRWLAESNTGSDTDFKSAFLMKVFFSGNQTPAESIAMLKAFISDCNNYLSTMEPVPSSVEQFKDEVSTESRLYWEFSSDFATSYLNMCIQWAERCISRLEAL